MPNCKLFHTIEKHIFITVKNWWPLPYGQVYVYLEIIEQHISPV
jgi:hypothetical protein